MRLIIATAASLALAASANVAALASTTTSGYVKTDTAVVQWDEPNTLIVVGQNDELGKTQTLTCPAKAGCIIVVQATLEFEAESDNQVLVIAKIDDNKVNPAQGFNFHNPPDGNEDAVDLSYSGSLKVAAGKHTIKLFINAANDVKLQDWHETIQLLQ
jgi:co-chaperonin GroES (HSP10)